MADDTLIDKYLPQYSFNEYHEIIIENSIENVYKAARNFHLKKINLNQTILSTETRVLCISPVTRITFGLYWLAIKPFSGIIRKKMLQIIKQDSETINKQ